LAVDWQRMKPDTSVSRAETERILAEYSRRTREIDPNRYAAWQPDVVLSTRSRKRCAAELLRSMGVFPAAETACLEVGYGSLGWLGLLRDWGIRERCLHGIELDAERAAKARQVLPSADLRIGDACDMPWRDESFRLVIASTVFTSILDDGVRRLLSREIVRVLAPGGALVV
jgi:trans-aconitate methyltransferase